MKQIYSSYSFVPGSLKLLFMHIIWPAALYFFRSAFLRKESSMDFYEQPSLNAKT